MNQILINPPPQKTFSTDGGRPPEPEGDHFPHRKHSLPEGGRPPESDVDHFPHRKRSPPMVTGHLNQVIISPTENINKFFIKNILLTQKTIYKIHSKIKTKIIQNWEQKFRWANFTAETFSFSPKSISPFSLNFILIWISFFTGFRSTSEIKKFFWLFWQSFANLQSKFFGNFTQILINFDNFQQIFKNFEGKFSPILTNHDKFWKNFRNFEKKKIFSWKNL